MAAGRAAEAARTARPQFPRYDDARRARRSRREGPVDSARRKRHRPRPISAAGRAAASGGTHPRTVCTMNLGEILSGVALLQPLAPELAQAADRRPRVRFAARAPRNRSSSPFPAVRPTDASSPPMRWRAAPWPWSANRRARRISPARWIQVEHGRQALALAARNFLRPARRAPRPHRHHRHQRQDHHVVPDRFRAARGRQDHRADRHHRVSPGRARPARPSTPRRNRSICCACSPSWRARAART